MNINQAAQELEFRTGVGRFVWVLLAISIAVNMILAVMAYTNKTTHRETIVPPSIQKSFWVDGEKVAPEYLEQMGKFLIDLALNNTPLNCETNRIALLKYVGSGSYGNINAQQAANCKIIQQSRLSNFFAASNVTVSEKERAVIFTGSMGRWLGEKRLPEKSAAYRIKMGYSGGRIYVEELVEVDLRNVDPFSPAAVKKDVIEQMQADVATQAAANAEEIASKPMRAASEPTSATPVVKGN